MSDDSIPTILTSGHKMNKKKVLGIGAALAATVAVGIGLVASYSKSNKAEETIQEGSQNISNTATQVSGWKDNVEGLVRKAEDAAKESETSSNFSKLSAADAKIHAKNAKDYKDDAYKAAAEKPVVEIYKMSLTYENPLVAQMLPGLVKAAYQKAVDKKDWAVYDIAARFFVDQNIDVAPHDGNISKEEYKKFVDANPDLEIIVSPDKIADEFEVEMPSEAYRAKWREIRAKVNRIADIEQKNRWSDVEFVRYTLMPGMEKTPDGKGYFTSKAYGDRFEGRVNTAIGELEGKR